MKNVSINITQNDRTFIDPNTGQEMSATEFNQKYSQFGVGGLGGILSRSKVEKEEGKN